MKILLGLTFLLLTRTTLTSLLSTVPINSAPPRGLGKSIKVDKVNHLIFDLINSFFPNTINSDEAGLRELTVQIESYSTQPKESGKDAEGGLDLIDKEKSGNAGFNLKGVIREKRSLVGSKSKNSSNVNEPNSKYAIDILFPTETDPNAIGISSVRLYEIMFNGVKWYTGYDNRLSIEISQECCDELNSWEEDMIIRSVFRYLEKLTEKISNIELFVEDIKLVLQNKLSIEEGLRKPKMIGTANTDKITIDGDGDTEFADLITKNGEFENISKSCQISSVKIGNTPPANGPSNAITCQIPSKILNLEGEASFKIITNYKSKQNDKNQEPEVYLIIQLQHWTHIESFSVGSKKMIVYALDYRIRTIKNLLAPLFNNLDYHSSTQAPGYSDLINYARTSFPELKIDVQGDVLSIGSFPPIKKYLSDLFLFPQYKHPEPVTSIALEVASDEFPPDDTNNTIDLKDLKKKYIQLDVKQDFRASSNPDPNSQTKKPKDTNNLFSNSIIVPKESQFNSSFLLAFCLADLFHFVDETFISNRRSLFNRVYGNFHYDSNVEPNLKGEGEAQPINALYGSEYEKAAVEDKSANHNLNSTLNQQHYKRLTNKYFKYTEESRYVYTLKIIKDGQVDYFLEENSTKPDGGIKEDDNGGDGGDNGNDGGGRKLLEKLTVGNHKNYEKNYANKGVIQVENFEDIIGINRIHSRQQSLQNGDKKVLKRRSSNYDTYLPEKSNSHNERSFRKSAENVLDNSVNDFDHHNISQDNDNSHSKKLTSEGIRKERNNMEKLSVRSNNINPSLQKIDQNAISEKENDTSFSEELNQIKILL